MKLKIISTYEEFLNLKSIWNKTLTRSSCEHVCLTFEWFKAWWKAFGKGKKLLIILVSVEEEIIGIAPLMIYRCNFRGIPIRELGFIQNDNSLCSDFLLSGSRGEALDMILEYLWSVKDSWDVIRLHNIPSDSLTSSMLQENFKKNRIKFALREGLNSPYLSIQSDWKTYFESRSKKFHKVLRNKINRLSRLGDFKFNEFKGAAGLPEILRTIFQISRKSWKGRSGKDICASPENKEFFELLSDSFSQEGGLNIWVLEVGARAIAYEYHLVYKTKCYGLRSDFDEEFREYSPGSVLDSNIVKSMFGSGISEYDLGGTKDTYKMNWTNKVHQHVRFYVFKEDLLGFLLYSLEFRIVNVLKQLKKSL